MTFANTGAAWVGGEAVVYIGGTANRVDMTRTRFDMRGALTACIQQNRQVAGVVTDAMRIVLVDTVIEGCAAGVQLREGRPRFEMTGGAIRGSAAYWGIHAGRVGFDSSPENQFGSPFIRLRGVTIADNYAGSILMNNGGELDIDGGVFASAASGIELLAVQRYTVKVRNASLQSGTLDALYVEGDAASTFDFGTAAAPGGNTLASTFLSTPLLRIGAAAGVRIDAVGNRWRPTMQGSDFEGRYGPASSVCAGANPCDVHRGRRRRSARTSASSTPAPARRCAWSGPEGRRDAGAGRRLGHTTAAVRYRGPGAAWSRFHDRLRRIPPSLARASATPSGPSRPRSSTGSGRSTQVCDASRPPFVRWFVGGTTNLCHNAVDRHLAARAEQPALIYVSTETDSERIYSFAELHAEVQRMAAVLVELGVTQGDRVLIYMPMIPEAAFAMLACARIGAIHSVVFGGFASVSLASRIDDAEPKVIVSADAGSRAGKVIAYKPLLDEAIARATHKPAKVLLVDRGLAPMALAAGRDADLRAAARAPSRHRRALRLGRRPPTPATPSTPAARPAGPRACSATPAATRWRWRRA